MAQKTKYTPELLEEICERLALGEPMESICRDAHMPSSRVVYSWAAGEVPNLPPTIASDIARARELGFDAIAERTRHIARGVEGSTRDVARDKLIIETDLKLLSKWSKRYGDRAQLDVVTTEGAPTDPALLAQEISKLYEAARQKMLASPVVTDADFTEIPDDGSDLC